MTKGKKKKKLIKAAAGRLGLIIDKAKEAAYPLPKKAYLSFFPMIPIPKLLCSSLWGLLSVCHKKVWGIMYVNKWLDICVMYNDMYDM